MTAEEPRYVARASGGVGTWLVEDTHETDTQGRIEVVVTYWGWVHPNPKEAAQAEAARLNGEG